MPKKPFKKEKIIIEVEYATEWQYQIHSETIKAILQAIVATFERNPSGLPQCKHKDNKITVTYE